MSSSSKTELSMLHHEEAAWKPLSGQKLSYGQKLKSFLRKTWWMFLIVAIVLVVVLIPILLLVIYPNIAQSAVNKASIVVLAQTAYSPTPSSVGLQINNTFLLDSSYHPNLFAFNASLYNYENSTDAFSAFESPEIDKVHNGSSVFVNQTVPVLHSEEFALFTKRALVSDNFDFIVRGSGGLKQGAFPTTTVTYNQKASLTGLGGLNQLTVGNVTMLNKTLSDGTNAQGTIYLYNPSVITLDLGNVSLTLTGPAPNNTALGTNVLLNTLLKPGNNTLSANIVSNVVGIASIITQDKRYGCGIFPVTITGNNVTVNGEDIPYYTSAIKTVNLTTTLNLKSTLEDAGYGSIIGTCQS